MDFLTKLWSPFRLVVKKTGTNTFQTVVDNETEKMFDILFSQFIRKFGTHFIHEAEFGAKLVYTANLKKFDIKDFDDKDKNECIKKIFQEKFKKKAFRKSNSDRCSNEIMKQKLERSAQIEETNFFSKGSGVANPSQMEDIKKWTSSPFPDSYMIDFKLYPIINLFDKKIMTKERITDKYGNGVNVDGLLSWMIPRYSILLNRCRNLENHKVAADGASCEECPKNRVPSLDGFKCVCGEDFETSKNGQCKSKWKVKFEITFAKIEYFHSYFDPLWIQS